MTPRITLIVALLALGAAALLAACASNDRFEGPGGAERLYRARCSRCHVPWSPGDFFPEEWPRLVEEMGPRAGLTAAERARVLTYLQEASAAVNR